MGEIIEVHILARKSELTKQENDKFVGPCGACRQVISEASNNVGIVYMYKFNGETKKIPITELLPYSFGKNDLK